MIMPPKPDELTLEEARKYIALLEEVTGNLGSRLIRKDLLLEAFQSHYGELVLDVRGDMPREELVKKTQRHVYALRALEMLLAPRKQKDPPEQDKPKEEKPDAKN